MAFREHRAEISSPCPQLYLNALTIFADPVLTFRIIEMGLKHVNGTDGSESVLLFTCLQPTSLRLEVDDSEIDANVSQYYIVPNGRHFD